MRGRSLLLILLAFWIGLSLQLTNPFLMGVGLVTALVVVWISTRHDIIIRDWSALRLLRAVRYLPWLTWQVLVANLRVIRIVWTPGPLAIDPRLIEVPSRLETATGRVIYANSITLTPGTVTVDLLGDRLLVHALTAEDAEDLLSGSMHDRVRALEPGAEPEAESAVDPGAAREAEPTAEPEAAAEPGAAESEACEPQTPAEPKEEG